MRLIGLALVLCGSLGLAHTEHPDEGLPLWYFRHPSFVNFGDHLSLMIVERIVSNPVEAYKRKPKNNRKKLLALGSILHVAEDGDVIWGSGVNGKDLALKKYNFSNVDVRAVRGPLTRDFLIHNLDVSCPEVYGDPALLLPYLFTEFQKSVRPSINYLIIPHYSDVIFFPKAIYQNVVYPWEPWDEIVKKILDSEFVISSSLHGVVVAEAFGIPARLLRLTNKEPLFKFTDYYLGTNRPHFQYAKSIEDALLMRGEPPIDVDLQKLYESFPFEFWPNLKKKQLVF